MVTLAQLKSERKKSFRAVLRDLNKVQKQLNLVHRDLTRRLTKHNVELLDVADATKVVDGIKVLWDLTNNLSGATAMDLAAFFS